jgi:hypothetical protein
LSILTSRVVQRFVSPPIDELGKVFLRASMVVVE